MKTILKLNEEYNGLKFTQVNGGFVVVDLEAAINVNDWYIGYETNYDTDPKERWVVYNCVSLPNGNPHFKIVFTNLNLEGVPEIEEEETLISKVKELGKEISELSLTSDDKFWVGKLAGIGEVLKMIKKSEAQQNLFTEEECIGFLRYFQQTAELNFYSTGENVGLSHKEVFANYIQSLKQPKVEITFENDKPVKCVLC